MDKQVVVITGASAGVGHATARVGRQQARVGLFVHGDPQGEQKTNNCREFHTCSAFGFSSHRTRFTVMVTFLKPRLYVAHGLRPLLQQTGRKPAGG